ncbi:hypothetical protein D9758_007257 [Tetrapyrgos nigripes]|uniref:Uncharacterized protein n=1 Tax=Tetrapyrgos nigripes TaxID=182062 RepID=A0A8H5D3K3_9AGAR|nr:hypothetical protein D9758_007257 [Tetrapyrgos nigripes]
MLFAAKSYWHECLFPSKRYLLSRSYGDRAFVILEGGLIIRMRVRNVTASPEWEGTTTDGTAAFKIDVTLIKDTILAQMLKPLPAADNSDTDPVFFVQLQAEFQLTLDETMASYLDFGEGVTLVSVRRENMPMVMTVHGSSGQTIDFNLGLDDNERSWVDILSSADRSKESVWSDSRGNRSSLVTGQWHRSANSGEAFTSEVMVGTGKTTDRYPFQFGSHWVSVHIMIDSVAVLPEDSGTQHLHRSADEFFNQSQRRIRYENSPLA